MIEWRMFLSANQGHFAGTCAGIGVAQDQL